MTENTFSAPNMPARPRIGSLSWLGAFLVVLGGVFLLQTLGILDGSRWWADFILLPALILFGLAWLSDALSGRRLRPLARILFGLGMVTLAVALMFLFNLDWMIWWPVMLIVPGLAVFINGYSGHRGGRHPGWAGVVRMAFWLGLATMLLGAAFLLGNLGIFDLMALSRLFPWWGLAILLPGLGAFVNAGQVAQDSGRRMTLAAQVLVVIGLAACATAVVALFRLDWNLLAPTIVILAGVSTLAGGLLRR